MLKLTVMGPECVMISDASHDQISFPTDKETEQMVRAICPNGETEVTQRHPASLILRLPPGITEIDRARLLTRMDDEVSRIQFR
jgi:hypothetical protein